MSAIDMRRTKSGLRALEYLNGGGCDEKKCLRIVAANDQRGLMRGRRELRWPIVRSMNDWMLQEVEPCRWVEGCTRMIQMGDRKNV